MMHCPRVTADCCPEFDHTELWVPADEPHRPFIMSSPYKDEVPDGICAYTRAHALEVSSSPADRWYHPNALPIRLTATHTEVYPWPLGTRAVVLQQAFPVEWPLEEPASWQDWAEPPRQAASP
jgi:hypothetical protein